MKVRATNFCKSLALKTLQGFHKMTASWWQFTHTQAGLVHRWETNKQRKTLVNYLCFSLAFKALCWGVYKLVVTWWHIGMYMFGWDAVVSCKVTFLSICSNPLWAMHDLCFVGIILSSKKRAEMSIEEEAIKMKSLYTVLHAFQYCEDILP